MLTGPRDHKVDELDGASRMQPLQESVFEMMANSS